MILAMNIKAKQIAVKCYLTALDNHRMNQEREIKNNLMIGGYIRCGRFDVDSYMERAAWWAPETPGIDYFKPSWEL